MKVLGKYRLGFSDIVFIFMPSVAVLITVIQIALLHFGVNAFIVSAFGATCIAALYYFVTRNIKVHLEDLSTSLKAKPVDFPQDRVTKKSNLMEKIFDAAQLAGYIEVNGQIRKIYPTVVLNKQLRPICIELTPYSLFYNDKIKLLEDFMLKNGIIAEDAKIEGNPDSKYIWIVSDADNICPIETAKNIVYKMSLLLMV